VDAIEPGVSRGEGSVGQTDVPHVPALAADVVRRLPIDGIAVSVCAGPNTSQLLYATDAVAAQLDEIQFTLGEGPCVEAYRLRHHVLASDLYQQSTLLRWPVFVHEATEAGAGAIFAFPLQVGAVPFGTVELYRQVPGALADSDTSAALQAVEDIVRIVLSDLGRPGLLEPTAMNPEPMFGRAEVPQATGMMAVQLDVPIPEALAQLRAAAYAAHRPVQDVARDVIARRLVFGEPKNSDQE